ncbi:jg24697 [Pararge aegeria aegeria]|uniref:RNA-directed DNA polymerase n=2 Tax=Pararge aegeria TaxID=116150 RepID=A0A8S4R1H4_9NEOP|nr:jg24697 [Pararge aegeria aegeria]
MAATIRQRDLRHGEPPAKRPRLRNNRDAVVCFKCGLTGHRQAYCNNDVNMINNPKPLLSTTNINESSNQTERPKRKCSYCDKIGHTESTCFKKMGDEAEKINLAGEQDGILTPMAVNINNQKFIAFYDSGAARSLVGRSISQSIPGKREDCTLMLKGIGSESVPILSCQKINVTCDINGVFVEIAFHVVEDHETPCGLLIGAEIVKGTGLSVLVTEAGATVVRKSTISNIEAIEDPFGNLDTDLTNAGEIRELKIVLTKYAEGFATGIPKKQVTTGSLAIQLKDPTKIVSRRPYRMAPVERQKLKQIINDLVLNGIVRESTSDYASPVILVKKKNGEDRMCTDYRELNKNTIPIKFPLPIISDQIDRLSDATYFISLDMAQGFYQIPIKEDSVPKTAFITPDGLYEYVRMPFGLMNAPAVFQRAIITALRPLLDYILVYMDDVLIKCKTFTEGLQTLDKVLAALTKAGFTVNAKKCSFFKTSIEYLGNLITNGTVRPSPSKVEALEKSAVPTNVKQVRQFCGLAGYFRRFIPSFSERLIPLYNLTKKGVKFQWTAECESVRLDIIRRLTSSPVITIFQEGLPIELHTDASSTGLGAVLIQLQNCQQHVVAYMSMRTTEPESHYHSYELETLAIIRAVKHFRQYLYGRSFTIITDCNAIKSSSSKRELLPRIHRWWSFLQQYDFKIEYRQGRRMKHADFFSRYPKACINLAQNVDTWLKVEQRRDAELAKIIKKLENNDQISDFRLNKLILEHCNDEQEPGCKKWKKVVPKTYQWSIINAYHTALKHFGWEKTLSKIRENYWFPEMSTTVRRFIDNCVICKTSKGPSGAKQIEMFPIEKRPVPFDTIHIDMTGHLTKRNNKYEYVVVIIDAYTKFVTLTYATNKTANSMLCALKHIVSLFGAPRQIISDQDTAFKAEFEAFCKIFNIHQHFIAPGASRANGQVERMMSVVKNGLTIIRNYETQDWKKGLEALQLAINCTKNKTTNVSPIKALTGRQCAVPPELVTLIDEEEGTVNRNKLNSYIQKKIDTQGKQDKARFDQGKAKVKRFQKEDIVLFKSNPRCQIGLDLKYPDAYVIWKILPNDRYQVKKINGRGRPKKVAHDQLRIAPKPNEGINQDSMSAEDRLSMTPDRESEIRLNTPEEPIQVQAEEAMQC